MEKNNRLIAEFMGYTLNENDEYPIEYITVQGHWDTCSIQDLNYHKSWDWLMKVVEKIENIKIKDYSISTDITDDKTFINVWHYGDGGKWSILISNLNEEYKDFNKMQRTYKAVIEFINFYNKQKEE